MRLVFCCFVIAAEGGSKSDYKKLTHVDLVVIMHFYYIICVVVDSDPFSIITFCPTRRLHVCRDYAA